VRLKTLSFVLSLSMVLSFPSLPAGATEAWVPNYPTPSEGSFGLEMGETDLVPASVVEGSWWDGPNDRLSGKQPNGNKICYTIGEFPCVISPKTHIHGNILAPACKDSSTNCIKSVFAIVDGARVDGSFLGYQNDLKFTDLSKLGMVGTARTISLWDIPGATHTGGTSTYAVGVGYGFDVEQGRFTPRNFKAVVYPFVETPMQGANEVRFFQGTNGDGKPWVNFGGPPNGCVWSKAGVCGKQYEFDESLEIGLELKFENYFTNWFRARLTDPDVQVKPLTSQSKLITVSGRPVRVPMFQYVVRTEDLPTKTRQTMIEDGLRMSGSSGISNDRDLSFFLVDGYRTLVGDQAAGTITAWTFSNLNVLDNHPCTSRRQEVIGMVTTNAMVFQPYPPAMSKGFLNYEVGGMHYLPGGEELATGTYDLLMRSSVARCFYNLGNIPISAKVSVVNDKGRKEFATTTVSEKKGWLKLSASGFTFSKKTIKVKITKTKR